MEIKATIHVKSLPEVFNKEVSGIKNNTTRIVSHKEDKELQKIINNLQYIHITEKSGKGLPTISFARTLKDITRFEFVVTWAGAHQKTCIGYVFTWE